MFKVGDLVRHKDGVGRIDHRHIGVLDPHGLHCRISTLFSEEVWKCEYDLAYFTEAEWLACTDPRTLLEAADTTSERRRRLYVFAFWRFYATSQWTLDDGTREWRLEELKPERYRERLAAVELAERYLEGKATPAELVTNHRAVAYCSHSVKNTLLGHIKSADQCPIIREVFGNPFRPVQVVPAWLTWNDGTMAKMARHVYEEKAFDLLPILADALEDAGCDSVDLLSHCRGGGQHVRGCWAVELLLSR